MMRTLHCDAIREHYLNRWHCPAETIDFHEGPIDELSPEFRILRFPPWSHRNMWTYATQCMSRPDDSNRMELHLFSAEENWQLAELLVATAHYHRTGARLGLGHTVNFGRPWLRGSSCDHGLISLPYLDGPSLEWLKVGGGKVRFLWLIPITKREVEFARNNGPDALESRFQELRFNYLDPARKSVV
jgi:hypothetical protein